MNNALEPTQGNHHESEVLLREEYEDRNLFCDNAEKLEQEKTNVVVVHVTEFESANNSTPSVRSALGLGFQAWKFELLACLVAVLALVAIVLTLGMYNGRPLPDWPFRISINALISIFSVIFKAALMFPIVECTYISDNLLECCLTRVMKCETAQSRDAIVILVRSDLL